MQGTPAGPSAARRGDRLPAIGVSDAPSYSFRLQGTGMPRSIWKGNISFGLVTIGVELYNAEAPQRIDLDLLDKRDMSRIGYLKINKRTSKPVPNEDIV